MTLPLIEAYRAWKKGELTWEDYIHNIFRGVAGDPHEDDDWRDPQFALAEVDSFAYSIFSWHRVRNFIKDTAPMEAVFLAYRNESPDEVDKKLNVLEADQQEAMTKALAMLALRERRSEMLKMCLDHGFRYETDFEDAANLVKQDKNPKTYKVIDESEFRRQYPRNRRRPKSPRGFY